MEITDVKVRLVNKEDSRLKGFATITLDNCFVVHGIRIVEHEDKLLVSMPNRKRADGTFKDVAHPINQETRKIFDDTILEAYQKEVENPTEEAVE